MNKCHVCNGEGKPGGCPRCGLTPRGSTDLKLAKVSVPSDIIPVPYQGVAWERVLDETLPIKFKQFDETLEKVYNMFLSGKIPAFSMFIAAPPKSGKNNFAYACMQAALANQLKVAPLLSTSDWRRLYKVSQMNPFYKLYNKYQWDFIANTDVVFLFVDHSDDHNDDIPLLKTILDTRSAFNLPTFIISDYRLNDLVPRWDQESYTMIYTSQPKRDFLRYPIIIHRFE